jgi:hypothetical protein
MNTNSNNSLSGPQKNDLRTLRYLPNFQLKWPMLPEKMEKGLYTFNINNFEYDFIYKPSNKNRLFVMLSGNADRKRLNPPIFQRWTWARYFPGHCLYISDPTLKLHEDLGIAWYIGTKTVDILPVISEIITNVASKINVPIENIILYASSGGAYTALRLSSMVQGIITVAINPQIDVTKFSSEEGLLQKFLNICFEGVESETVFKWFPERFNAMHNADMLLEQRIIYVQNILDLHHYNVHFPLFAEKMGLSMDNNFQARGIETIFFEHPGGHNKGETPEIFTEIINKVVSITE